MPVKTIYVVGSFRDLDASRGVAQTLAAAGYEVLRSEPGYPAGIDGCLRRIDAADLVYVCNPRGEVGKSVSVDLGYAIARGKPIHALRPVEDPPLGHRITVTDPSGLTR